MAVNRYVDRTKGSVQWRATYGGASETFSVNLYGEELARQLATCAEIRLKRILSVPKSVNQSYAPDGYYFHQSMSCKGKPLYRVMLSNCEVEGGRKTTFSFSIRKYGVAYACVLAVEKQIKYGRPTVSVAELVGCVNRWMASANTQ